ncbi:MAG: MarR family transcriptional regulator [Micrococcaceae bacterium]|jgi:DNA-binding MarR family transcriptional regulator|uniref:MarR family winged helix-turn-helix transcriptional regulator n=1 Tax=Arthrobacter sp. PL16 TaxID=3071720 RepID=UPI002E048E52|nr:MarR family transcriptional regulator [Micrococcaceae bacterium]MEC5198178.1 DNA-binding MarR family transcriptional regulator [Arthrobacter sp. PL16]
MPDLDQWPTGRLLTTAARLVEHAWNERLVDIGVTHAGVIALGVLADQGAMTQASLAQIVRVQAQTMGKTLSRLESRGHVTRVRNDLDRRSHMVSIAPGGRHVLEAADDIERTLVAGGGLVSDELRSHLQVVIRELGAPRWNWPATSPSAEGSSLENPGASGPAATVPG